MSRKHGVMITALFIATAVALGGCLTLQLPETEEPTSPTPAATQPTLTPEPTAPHPEPAPTPATTHTPAPQAYIFSDTVDLAPLDEQAIQVAYPDLMQVGYWDEWYQYPLNEYGFYASKPFYLEGGETLELVLITDYPVPFEMLDTFPSGGVMPDINLHRHLPQGGEEQIGTYFDTYQVEMTCPQ